MKNKLFRYFCAKTAFFAALSLLLPTFSVLIAEGQIKRARANSAQPEATFTNSASISIPSDGPANPYPSTINVSGLNGTILSTPGSVKVTLNNFTHSFPDDVDMILVGPTGAAFRFFSGITTGSGSGSPASNVTFTVSDDGAAPLPNNGALTAGTYQPAAYYTPEEFPAPGPGTNYSSAAPSGEATFTSVFGGTNPNGNWNLFIIDFAQGDSGSISGGWTLEITTGGGGAAQPFDNRLDYFGNGFSDWAVVNTPAGGNFTWFIARNDNPTPVNGRIIEIPFGLAPIDSFARNRSTNLGIDRGEGSTARDEITAFGDYTGDGLSDINVWRPGAQALYWILRSETGQAFATPWGTTGDFVGSEGDYDGDNKMDLTVLRPENGMWRWFVLRSGTNTFSTFVYGVNADAAPYFDFPLAGADYTGDGADDPAVARVNKTSLDILWVVGTTSGGLINKVQWGNFNSDFIVPAGDYDGDGKADFAVWRGAGNAPAVNGEWLILKSAGGVTNFRWGISGPGGTNPNRDLALRSGDYDGDDKTDIAVWRPSNQTFYVFRSSDGQLMQQKWGFPDLSFPVGNFGVF